MLTTRVMQLFSNLLVFFKPLPRRLVLIVVLGFLARLVTYSFIKNPWIIFDEFIYLDTARQIVRGQFMSDLKFDSQLYPAGWPILLATVGGFFKDPSLQYQVLLTFNMLLSSLIPLLVYALTGSLWVSFLISFFPPLFVYSSSIMSETMYTFMLLTVIVVIKYIIRDDLRKGRTLVLASFVLGAFFYYTNLVRSVGIVLIPAFILTSLLILYLQYKEKAHTAMRQLVYFSVLTIFSYYLSSYIGAHTLFNQTVFYEKTPYLKSMWEALSRLGLSFSLLRNELTITAFFLFFFLPVFSVHEFIKEFHKKEWHLLFPRIMTWLVYLGTLGLTFTHMFIGAKHNPQYMVFSRYLDPVLVLLAAFALRDFVAYLETKTLKVKLPIWVYLITGYFVYYLLFSLPALNYKFGNTMPVYLFLWLKQSFLMKASLVIIVALCFYLLRHSQKMLLGLVFLLFYFSVSWLSISQTTSTPAWVQTNYVRVMDEWQTALNKYSAPDIPICIYKNRISTEVFYLYHYLYPYQYIEECSNYENPPKLFLTNKSSRFSFPETCVRDFKFSSGESIFYCPLGLK